jgi:predicted small lipoprotein YifL
MHHPLSALALSLCLLLLAGCGDSGPALISDPNPKINGESDEAFQKSVARVRAALSPDDADRFDSIIAAKRWTTGQGREEFNGMTAAQIFAKADKAADEDRQKMHKVHRLNEQLEELRGQNLPPEEERAKRHALLKEIKAQGVYIPDSAFDR